MIETYSTTQIQTAKMCIVLHEDGLLSIVCRLMEEKVNRSRRIENGLPVDFRRSDVVRKPFVNEAIDGIRSNLDFVVRETRRDGSAEITFQETTILKWLDRS